MVYEIISVSAIIGVLGCIYGIISVKNRLESKISKANDDAAALVQRSRDDTIDLVQHAIDVLEDNWEADSDKLVDVVDEEIKDMKRDIFSVAKSPNVAKKNLKEKYKDILE